MCFFRFIEILGSNQSSVRLRIHSENKENPRLHSVAEWHSLLLTCSRNIDSLRLIMENIEYFKSFINTNAPCNTCATKIIWEDLYSFSPIFRTVFTPRFNFFKFMIEAPHIGVLSHLEITIKQRIPTPHISLWSNHTVPVDRLYPEATNITFKSYILIPILLC